MTRMPLLRRVLPLWLALAATVAPAGAQVAPDPAWTDTAATAAPAPWRPMRLAKWATVGIAASAAAYGLVNNQRADDAYEELEAMCQADIQRCRARATDGTYFDAQLESGYQRVRRLDRRAQAGLVAGQVAVAAAVALFILDLRNDRPPPNIPYEPRTLEIAPTRDNGIEVRLRLPLPVPR